jgi:hypothetical protein
MLKFSLSTHTSLNKPNACLLSYIHTLPPRLVASVPEFLNSFFFHDFLMMIQNNDENLLHFLCPTFDQQHHLLLSLSLFCRTLLFPVRSSAHQFYFFLVPSVIKDTSGVDIKQNADCTICSLFILHNFPFFLPLVQWQYLWIYIIYIYMVGLFPSTSSSRSQIETEMEFIEREYVVRETFPRDAGHRSCLF